MYGNMVAVFLHLHNFVIAWYKQTDEFGIMWLTECYY